jgi:hypothetical protein
LASSSDWAGFLGWTARGVLLLLALAGICALADVTTGRLFGNRPDALGLLGTQAVDAVFNGLAFAIAATVVFLRRFVAGGIARLFVLAWAGFSVFSFALSVSLPLPLWQVLALKVPVGITAFWVVWLIRRNWWKSFWVAADGEVESS